MQKKSKVIEKFLLCEEMDRLLEITDFRQPEKTTYPVGLILLCALVGVTMGANSWNDIAYAAGLRSSTLLKYYPNVKQTPSHDTLRRFFSLANTDELEKIYRAWAKALLMGHFEQSGLNESKKSAEGENENNSSSKKGIHVAIDGKTNRGAMSQKGTTAKTKMHILNAFATEFGICLGQRRMEEKTGEISNLPVLIKELFIGKGDVVTIDAIGTQREIAKAIVEKKADYILTVKGNQKSLKKTIEDNLKEEQCKKNNRRHDEAEEWDNSHGRSVHRYCFISTEPLCLGSQKDKWEGVQSYGLIRTTRTVKSTKQETVDTQYFISSLKGNAATIMKYKRDHWKVENNLHWMLDVQYKEDDDRKKENSAQNFALINKMVLAILKLEETKQTQGRKRMRAAADPLYLEKVIELFIKYFAKEE